ncbi:MAG: 16S rRNA (cytosine(1402)-N(4))-methyltransferase RsmH [Cyclobacteriaceae bacterium]
MSAYHTPVLFKQCIDALEIKPDGTYIDVTFGGGGHSRGILEKLTTGKLYAFDQDLDAEKNAQALSKELDEQRSFIFIDSNFRNLKRFMKFHGETQVDGILADLGVSSHQFDEGSRGFSTRFDGELDMRMDQKAKISAVDIVNDYEEADLVHLLSAYGEVKNARTLARTIVLARQHKIQTNKDLKEVVLKNAPRGREYKYLAQVFQAIRIEVNDEMAALHEFLEQTEEVIKPGGKLVVMSYHSLEDRPVKNYLNTGNIKGKMEKDFFGHEIRPFKPLTRKPIIPDEEEIDKNRRARSAKLRIAERI